MSLSLVGLYESWSVREHQNRRYAYAIGSVGWPLSITVGPIFRSELKVRQKRARSFLVWYAFVAL